ncbi:MAG: 2Fe-2S iron-sulfur cluster-binding protein [Steroidobacteraceae bacterium]
MARLTEALKLAPGPSRAASDAQRRAAPPAPSPANGAAGDAEPDERIFRVTFSKSGHTLACRADQSILSAVESAGLPLPFSCREGRCGTCRSRLLSGEVDMRHAGGIRQRQIDLGDILVCCSRPLSDIVIER